MGEEIDFANTRRGAALRLSPEVRVNLGRHLRADLNGTWQRLNIGGERLFLARVADVRVIWQFDNRTFVRLITRYSDVARTTALYRSQATLPETKSWSNEVLFSYKLNPQTVLFLGYSDNHFGERGIDLTQADRTLFLKLGYAFRM